MTHAVRTPETPDQEIALITLDHWIDGRAVPPESGGYRAGRSPATGQEVTRVAQGTAADVNSAVAAAAAAATPWRYYPPFERGRLLGAVATAIRAQHTELTRLEILETGKPQATAEAEVEGAAAFFEFYAGLVNLPTGEVLGIGSGLHSYTQREPYGVVGIITPWNVPINQAARAGAPALAAGNTVVLKPSEFTSSTSVTLARIATEVGFPDGVFNVVLGNGPGAGAPLVEHPLVRKLAFTGSVIAGRAIGRLAADKIMPLTLELGGKSANLVFEDADIAAAAAGTVKGFTTNSGQVCSASTRLLVQRSIHDKMVTALVEHTKNVRPGSTLGPLITGAQFDKVTEYFGVAADEGATAVAGGQPLDDAERGGGFYVPATIYTGVAPDSRMATEEIFGPVLVVIPFDDEADAVRIANASEYGLVAGLWTRDVARALRVAGQLEAGQVFVNTWTTGAVQTPFGGYKQSGYGREKGIEALHHYTQLKSVTIAMDSRAPEPTPTD